MPIVINEFEIMVEPQLPQSAGRAPEPSVEQAQPLRPDEIVAVMQVYEERLQRVSAD
jgi:hypothetical protein